MTRALASCLLILGVLGACDRGPSVEELAKRDRLRAETTDPAVIDALSDPILADRALSIQDHSFRVRATPGPVQVTYPPDDGQPPLVPPVARCDGAFTPGPEWARRLPPELALPSGTRIEESAGREAPGCRLRYVRFASNAAPRALLDGYARRVAGAGYAGQMQEREGEHILSGTGAAGAFTLIVSPRPRGAAGALIVNVGASAP